MFQQNLASSLNPSWARKCNVASCFIRSGSSKDAAQRKTPLSEVAVGTGQQWEEGLYLARERVTWYTRECLLLVLLRAWNGGEGGGRGGDSTRWRRGPSFLLQWADFFIVARLFFTGIRKSPCFRGLATARFQMLAPRLLLSAFTLTCVTECFMLGFSSTCWCIFLLPDCFLKFKAFLVFRKFFF